MTYLKNKYRRLTQYEKDLAVKMYVDGNSLANTSSLLKVSRTQIFNLASKADTPENNHLLRRNLAVNLQKKGIDLNAYADAIRIRSRLHRNSIPIKDALSNMEGLLEMAYKEEMSCQDLIWLFNNFARVVDWLTIGPRDNLRHLMEIWLDNVEVPSIKLNELKKRCDSLKTAIRIREKSPNAREYPT
jgi:hypothetical protein